MKKQMKSKRSDVCSSICTELLAHLRTAGLFFGWVSLIMLFLLWRLWASVPEPKFAIHTSVAEKDWVVTTTPTSPLLPVPVATPLIKNNPQIELVRK